MVRSTGGGSEPWLQVFAYHPAVGSVTGWPREVLPVLLQPLCNLPVLAVATMLDVGAMWLYDRQLRRVILATTGQRSMAVLVGLKQLARIQGDHAQGHITEVLLSLPREMTTWVPTPVTRQMPWAKERSSRLGRGDSAWYSHLPGAQD